MNNTPATGRSEVMKYRYRFLIHSIWIVACLALFHFLYQDTKGLAIAELNGRQMLHGKQAVKGIKGYFDHWIASISHIAESESIIRLDDRGKNLMEILLGNHEPAVKGITRSDRNGRIVHTIPFDPKLIGGDISGQEHTKELSRTRKPVLSSVFKTLQGYRAIALTVPVFDGNEFEGGLGILLDFESISKEFLQDIVIGNTGYAWVTDKDGVELYCPVPGHTGNSVFENCKDFPTILSMAREMLNGREGNAVYFFNRIRGDEPNPVKKHAVYLPVRIANTFWSIVVATSEDEILASLVHFRNQLIGVIAVLLLGSLLFSYYAMRSWGIVKEEKKRRSAEVALSSSEEKFKAAFEGSHDAITITTADGRFLECNRKALEMFHLDSKEGFGARKPADFSPEYQPDGRRSEDAADEYRRKAIEERFSHFEWVHQRSTGEIFPSEITLTSYLLRGEMVLQATIRDIGDRKRTEEEREKLQAQLIQAQKMESVGRLAGGVAHDFNNMLGIIIGNAEMAALQLDRSHPACQCLEEILTAGNRSADTVRQLLAFARKQIISPKVLDLNDTVSQMLKMLRRLIGEDIDLAWLPGYALRPVKIDPSQVDQILANLAVNARDAIAGVGKLTIETSNVTIDEPYCANHKECLPGDYVLLAVSDNGSGMAGEVLEHLYEPFFTTKAVGKGTGLGLSTIYGIVKQNGGFINVYSELGHGTTFKVYLPSLKTEFSGDMPEKVPQRLPRGTETVLMVEDEEAILRVGKALLEELGYKVLTSSTPEDAVRTAKEKGENIHLLLTDIVMPGMNGRDLADRLKVICPGLKCLFMSGYTADVIAHHGVLHEGVIFLQKPFSMVDLARRVRETLDREDDENL
ncbi:MAG: response regulator [Desulfobacteraceae bacterium]|nr:MAG: response regulator [Desulfobacteraceae bacterium]